MVSWKRYCRKYQKVLTKQELEQHQCFNKKKGRNKGRACSLLQRIPSEAKMI